MATVTFIRDTTNNIASIPIVDGQIILSTDENFIYLDNGNQRIQYRNNGTSSGVQYTNTSSGLSSTDVQGAIDEVAARTNIATTGTAGVVKIDGTTIEINNGVISSPLQDANDVDYDNTTSGLTATDVQAAIDELKQAITNLINNTYTKTQIDNKLEDKMDKSAFVVTGNTLDIILNPSS